MGDLISSDRVALLAEGVDRNSIMLFGIDSYTKSPSSRRAWIEIFLVCERHFCHLVALLAEGVDRNKIQKIP